MNVDLKMAFALACALVTLGASILLIGHLADEEEAQEKRLNDLNTPAVVYTVRDTTNAAYWKAAADFKASVTEDDKLKAMNAEAQALLLELDKDLKDLAVIQQRVHALDAEALHLLEHLPSSRSISEGPLPGINYTH